PVDAVQDPAVHRRDTRHRRRARVCLARAAASARGVGPQEGREQRAGPRRPEATPANAVADFPTTRMRILATQETDWISRNPIIHHRLLEWLSTHGSHVRVIDYDIDWAKRKGGPIFQGREEFAGIHKYYADARVSLVRPAMLRLPLIARLSWLFGNWRELRAIFRDATPDVVIAYGISNALLTLGFCRVRRRPFVYHIMDALHTHAESAPLLLVARTV